MVTEIVVVCCVTWLVAAVVCYLFVRKAALNLLDPVILAGISIPFSATLLVALCASGVVPWEKFVLFCTVLSGYLVGIRLVGVFFRSEQFRNALIKILVELPRRQIDLILFLTVNITLILAAIGLLTGSQGDARQEFAKAFRPLVLIQSGLFLVSLVLLLTPKISSSKAVARLFVLVLCSLPFSGKSVLVPIVYWFGLKTYIERKAITLGTSFALFLVFLFGVGLVGVFAYGVSGISSFLYLFANRLWLSGDVYIYAYQQNALEGVRDHYAVTFLSYVMHPFTSLIGIRAYERPLGAMLSSEVAGEDLFTGPNPQLPVILDFFFPGGVFISPVIALVIGFLVMGIRSVAIYLAKSRSRYVRIGALTAAVFCPSAGFVDTSLVLVTLVGILAVTILGVVAELLLSGRLPKMALSKNSGPV